MTQTIRSVEQIADKRYLVETTYVPVWDGTERCGGRLLGSYGPPPPVTPPKTFLVIPPHVDAQIALQGSKSFLMGEVAYKVAASGTGAAEVTRKRRQRAARRTPPPVIVRPVVTRSPFGRACGPVFHARPAIWALLAEPVSVSDIRARIGGLPQHALQVALSLLLKAGGIVRAGAKTNAVRRPGIKATSLLYQRAPAYQDAPSWPLLPRPRA